MAPIHPNTSLGHADSMARVTAPQKLAVIAPLMTEGPVTYQTLLESLDHGPINYQLWLLVQVPATSPDETLQMQDSALSASRQSLTSPSTVDPPAFTPVQGVNATPLTWPKATVPRVVTIQYSGLQINQAINWAIRQASGDMILVLDAGLNGLLQLRQMLDEISATQGAVPPNLDAAPPSEISAWKPGVEEIADLEIAAEVPAHGALNRRLLERLEQWGLALQRENQPPRRRVPPHKMDLSDTVSPPAVRPLASINDEADALALAASPKGSLQRIDSDTAQAAPKKLPKFITRFHEFI